MMLRQIYKVTNLINKSFDKNHILGTGFTVFGYVGESQLWFKTRRKKVYV